MQEQETDSAQPHRLLGRLKYLARERTLGMVEQGRQMTGHRLPEPELRFDLRGQSAGQMRIDACGRATIRYNPALLLRHGEDFLKRTVPHEVAHYLAFVHHGRGIRPHGPEWQQMVRALGGEPERCHAYDVAGLGARKTRRFPYHCRCGDHELSSVRHNRITRGARYLCRHCGEALRAGSSQATTPKPIP